MLGSLRSFVGGWTAKILLVLLVGSFALWGVSGSMLAGADANTVARVGETKITIRDFLTVYNTNMNELQRQAGRRLTREQARLFGVESQALTNVVAYATLDEFARLNGMSLSDDTLAQLIADQDAFKDASGKFSRENFRQAVFRAQMRESDFIEVQNQSAIRSQIIRSFNTGDILPEVFKGAMSTFIEEERNFSYITVTAALAGTPPAPTDEQLKTYFEANKETYKAPEYRKLSIISVRPEDIADPNSITDEAVQADYDSRAASYSEPAKRRVQQIVFKSKELADKAVKDLAEGSTFETVLSDNDVKLTDADLGMMAQAQLPKVIADVAFAAELNTPSAIIDGPFGPTMVRVTETQDAKTTPVEDVADDIRKDLALRAAADTINTMIENVEDLRARGENMKTIADQLTMNYRLVEAVDRTARDPSGTVINDLPQSSELLSQAFQTQVGAEASPIDFGTAGYIWYSVDEIIAPRDRSQDEVTERVKVDWIAAEQAKLIEAKAAELKTRIEGGASIDAVAADLNILATKTGFFKRAGQSAEFPRAATLEGFKGAANHVAVVDAPKAGERLLLTVADVKRPEAQIVKAPEAEVQLANQGAADDLLAQMITKLQSEYAVTQNPTAINTALTQFR